MSPTSYQTAPSRDNKLKYINGNDPYGIRTHVTAVKGQCLKPLDQRVIKNGEGEIRTLAPLTRPIPLAGAPLQPLEYFSNGPKWT